MSTVIHDSLTNHMGLCRRCYPSQSSTHGCSSFVFSISVVYTLCFDLHEHGSEITLTILCA